MIEESKYKSALKAAGMSDEECERQWRMRLRRDYEHQWHVAINEHVFPPDGDRVASHEENKFMYEAKKASLEVERLALLFKHEREGKLPKTFRKCACCSNERHVVDNHTACCLGVECRKCPHLLALDKAQMPIEEIDRAKAWTCVAHIISKGGDWANEGYILTVDDRMFWDDVASSLLSEPPEQ